VGDDGVVLTDRERQALAGLAESIGDPWLARQLAGQDAASRDAAPPPRKRRIAGFGATVRRATNGWIGLVLVVAGAAVALATFIWSTLAASVGLAVMGFGAWRLATDRADDLMLRWTARQNRTAAGPPPPRTPPAAA
jgi:hypothetical protein